MESRTLGTVIIILLVGMWVLQFVFSYLQMRKFYSRVSQMRKDGLTSIGMSGSMYKRRIYGVLTVDKQDRIIHAEQLSGWTVLARLKPVDALIGKSLSELLDESVQVPINKKMISAFRSSANEIIKAREKANKQQPQENDTAKPELLSEAEPSTSVEK